jgi:hypothetical protein
LLLLHKNQIKYYCFTALEQFGEDVVMEVVVEEVEVEVYLVL